MIGFVGCNPYCAVCVASFPRNNIRRNALRLLTPYGCMFLVVVFSIFTGGALAQPTSTSSGQAYPTKPVRLVVPYSPAGVADLIGRVTAEKLGQRLGQNMVVFNREGGGSVVGTELVAKSTADGYTLLLASTALTMNAAVTRKPSYDVQRDFAPIGLVFVAPAVVDLVGGQIEMVMAGISIAAPLAKSGKLKALGITSRKRSPVLPEVRPIAEQGLPEYESSTWYGVFAPTATPPAILARLSTDLVQVANSAEVRERFASQGGEARSSTRDEFAALIAADLRRWQTVVSAAGLRAE